MILLAKLPSLYSTGLNTGFSVHYDNGGIGSADCLFNLSYEIKVTRRIQNIDL